MFVRDRMSAPATTVTPDTPFQEALRLMREHKFRRLPVVNAEQKLAGIVSERDLLHAAPSPATSLSVWEMNYLLSKLKVEQLMAPRVLTVSPDTPLEEAARLMVEHKIGGLPVVDAQRRVVGVITETDIFKALVEMLGSGREGVRLTLQVPGGIGTLARLTTAIAGVGGNIVSVGTYNVDLAGTSSLLIKVVGVRQEQLVETLEALGDHVVDVRTV
ncbi:MAG: CBS domain-containing protein [Caldilineaceae bacterium]|nr:CBS domain-containing protein [Caldilineaceae bacterium]